MATKTTPPPDTGTEMVPVGELSTKIPKLLENIETSLIGARAKVKALPKIIDEATKATAFALKAEIKLAMDGYHDYRMPFTRKLNDLIKRFTTAENEFQAMIDFIDADANKWAARQLELSRQAQAEADAQLRAEKAKIELNGRIKECLQQRIGALLDKVREAAGGMVNAVTKETLEETKTRLSSDPKWTRSMDTFYYEPPAWATDKANFKSIADAELAANKADYLTRAKQILVDSTAILQVALTNKEEALRLQQVNAEEEAKRIQENTAQSQAKIDAEKALATLDIERPPEANVRVKMKIEILDNRAWLEMIAFWYENDPAAKTADLSTKTFKQVKTYCERIVNSESGTMIDHPSLEYIEDVKAR